MANTRSNKPYGHGRVQFLAQLSAIRSELGEGQTLRAIHAKRVRKLGITYSAFAKLVNRYAHDARPAAAVGMNKEKENHERKAPAPREHSGTLDPALLRKLTRG